MRLCPNGTPGSITRSSSLSDEEKLALLLSGAMTLDAVQDQPPFLAVQHLENQLELEPTFGPQMKSPKLIQKNQDSAFKHNCLQQIVDGRPLTWYLSFDEVVTAGGAALTPNLESGSDLFSQLRLVRKEYLKSKAKPIQLRDQLSDEEMRAKHLVGGSLSNFLDRTFNYTRLEPDWYEYYLRLKSLKEGLGALVREGLSNGSVICGKEEAHHIVMVHPERAAALKLGSRKPKLHFIFSRELPRGWLYQDYTLAARRAKARDWMIRAFRHFEREGRRVTANDLMQLAQEFFDLTENAAKDAWKEARGPVGNPTHNFAKEMRVKLSEIRRID